MTKTTEGSASREAPTEPVDGRIGALGYRLFDADNHYYEPEDAFLRFMDHRLANKAPRWMEMTEGGGKRLVFGDRINRHLGADQTFSVVGRPGGLAQGTAAVQRDSGRTSKRSGRSFVNATPGWT